MCYTSKPETQKPGADIFKQTVNSQLTTLSVQWIGATGSGKKRNRMPVQIEIQKKKSLSQNLSHKVVRAKCLLGRQFWTEGTGRAMISYKQSHGEDTHICRWNENVDKHQKLGKTGFYQHRRWCHSRTSKHDITVLFFPSTEKAMRQQARKFYPRKDRLKKFLLSGWLRAFFLRHIKGAAQITG